MKLPRIVEGMSTPPDAPIEDVMAFAEAPTEEDEEDDEIDDNVAFGKSVGRGRRPAAARRNEAPTRCAAPCVPMPSAMST